MNMTPQQNWMMSVVHEIGHLLVEQSRDSIEGALRNSLSDAEIHRICHNTKAAVEEADKYLHGANAAWQALNGGLTSGRIAFSAARETVINDYNAAVKEKVALYEARDTVLWQHRAIWPNRIWTF